MSKVAPIQQLENTSIQQLENTSIQQLENTSIQQLENTSIQQLENTSIQQLENTSIQNLVKAIEKGRRAHVAHSGWVFIQSSQLSKFETTQPHAGGLLRACGVGIGWNGAAPQPASEESSSGEQRESCTMLSDEPVGRQLLGAFVSCRKKLETFPTRDEPACTVPLRYEHPPPAKCIEIMQNG